MLAIVVASVWWTYTWTLASSQQTRESVILLTTERDAAQLRLDSVRQQLAIAQRGAQITRGANDQLRDEFVVLQDKLAAERVDIEFYQRLLGAAGSSNGLAVHGVQLTRTASPRVYRFELTLSQNLKKAQIVVGRAELFIDGLDGDRARTLDVTSLDLGGADRKLDFDFKYFQLLRGSFALPDNFIAERLRVRLMVRRGRNGTPLWREFAWSDLFESKDPVEKK